jgi:hypothetical protein
MMDIESGLVFSSIRPLHSMPDIGGLTDGRRLWSFSQQAPGNLAIRTEMSRHYCDAAKQFLSNT